MQHLSPISQTTMRHLRHFYSPEFVWWRKTVKMLSLARVALNSSSCCLWDCVRTNCPLYLRKADHVVLWVFFLFFLMQTCDANISLTFGGHFLAMAKGGASYDPNFLLAFKGKCRRKVLRSVVSWLSRFGAWSYTTTAGQNIHTKNKHMVCSKTAE